MQTAADAEDAEKRPSKKPTTKGTKEEIVVRPLRLL